MTESKPLKTKTAITSKLAVMSYLDEMLHEATSTIEADVDVAVAPVEETVAAVERVQPAEQVMELPEDLDILAEPEPEPGPEPEPEPEPVPEIQIKAAEPVIEPRVVETVQEALQPQRDQPPVWQKNGRPTWAQERFDCLVFSVDGLKLAVPLLLLGNIHKLDRELTPLFDQPKWFLGLLPIQQDRTIRVVDTGQLVMPERYDPETASLLKFAVGVHDSDWAFGAHTIEGSISLEPDAVKWRSLRTSRPWLAGTVISEMCALIDLDAFSRILTA